MPCHLLPFFGILLALGGFAVAFWRLLQQPHGLNLVLLGVLALGALRIIWEFTVNRGRVPTIATHARVRRAIAAHVAAYGARNVIDLGSGAGQLTRTLAQALPQARITGIEYNRGPYWQARLWQALLGLGNITYIRGDLFAHDCRGADAVTLFVGKLTAATGDKLQRELAPGTLVISNDFPLPASWTLAENQVIHTPYKTTLYIYRR